MEHSLYVVVSREFGFSAHATIHATEEGALARLQADDARGMAIIRQRWHEAPVAGQHVRVSVTASPYDADYLDAYVRADAPGVDGRRCEVLP